MRGVLATALVVVCAATAAPWADATEMREVASRGASSWTSYREAAPPRRDESKKEHLARIFTRELVDSLWMDDYPDLDDACERGWLVEVPDDPEGLGVSIRKSGNSPVGEKERDPVRRAKLYRLAKPAAGLLYRIADHLRRGEGASFRPLQVTSLVRPWSYQRRLMASNINANTIRAGVPPTHVFGLAFDIPRGDMPVERQRRLQRYLDTLAADGRVVYFKEGRAQATYHVIAMPVAEEEFAADYVELGARAVAASASDERLACAAPSDPEFLRDEIWW